MFFWIFMLMMNLLIPGIMIIMGRLFQRKPPKKINNVYGYRTTRSTKSEEAWRFSHIYFGRLWFRWGRVLLLVSVLFMTAVAGRNIEIVGTAGGILCSLQCVVMILPIIPTERALKQQFGD